MSSRPRTLSELVEQERVRLQTLAVETLLRPKKDPFDLGVACGKFQGQWEMLDNIELLTKPQQESQDD